MNKQWKDRDKIRWIISDWKSNHNINQKDFNVDENGKMGYRLHTRPGTTEVFYIKETKGFIFKKKVLNLLSKKPGVVIGKAGTTIDELKNALKPYNVELRVRELVDSI